MMADQITTYTMTPDQMLAYESGRLQGLREALAVTANKEDRQDIRQLIKDAQP